MRPGLAALLFVLTGNLMSACKSDDPTLVVDVKTDLVPGEEFIGVRTFLETSAGMAVAMDQRVAVRSDDFINGERAFPSTSLAAGSYHVRVELIDRFGTVIAERSALTEVSTDFGITILIPRDNVLFRTRVCAERHDMERPPHAASIRLHILPRSDDQGLALAPHTPNLRRHPAVRDLTQSPITAVWGEIQNRQEPLGGWRSTEGADSIGLHHDPRLGTRGVEGAHRSELLGLHSAVELSDSSLGVVVADSVGSRLVVVDKRPLLLC